MKELINYGFGEEYLKDWGLLQALREIYQNYMDYGEYDTDVRNVGAGYVQVTLSNSYIPNRLEYLRLGNSNKNNVDAIGKHGEGLKMAFLVIKRSNLHISIRYDNYEILSSFKDIEDIGKCFTLYKQDIHKVNDTFDTIFTVPKLIHDKFVDNIIKLTDIIYHNYLGDIVDKPKGRIYSGGLYVTKFKNMQYAYNIKPSNLPLDRDRAVPGAFDVSWNTSKIKEDYIKHTQKLSGADTKYSDSEYVNYVPKSFKKQIKTKMVGTNVEFIHTNSDGVETVIQNDNIKDALKRDSVIARWIRIIKVFILKRLGVYAMLVEYKANHPMYGHAADDFNLILNKVKERNI